MHTRTIRSQAASLVILTVVLVSLACIIPGLDPIGIPAELTQEARQTNVAAQTQADLENAIIEATARHAEYATQTQAAATATEAARQTEVAATQAAGEAAVADLVNLKGLVTLVDIPVVATRSNQITLTFPSDGGEATGTIEYTVDLDYGAGCIASVNMGMTLTGTFDAESGQLQGSMNGSSAHVGVVSGCANTTWDPPEALSGTWVGQYDSNTDKATGQISAADDEGSGFMSFEAQRAP